MSTAGDLGHGEKTSLFFVLPLNHQLLKSAPALPARHLGHQPNGRVQSRYLTLQLLVATPAEIRSLAALPKTGPFSPRSHHLTPLLSLHLPHRPIRWKYSLLQFITASRVVITRLFCFNLLYTLSFAFSFFPSLSLSPSHLQRSNCSSRIAIARVNPRLVERLPKVSFLSCFARSYCLHSVGVCRDQARGTCTLARPNCH